ARQERRHGEPVLYGDASSAEILHHAGVERARVLVVAISDIAATRATVASVRRLNPNVHVIVRTRYMREIGSLVKLGSGEVVPEEFETSIEVFTRVLRRYLVPRDVIEREVRRERSGATVVAIQREGGGIVASPSGDEVLHPGDTILVMGRTDQLERAATLLRQRVTA